jgi:hypothetical protein
MLASGALGPLRCVQDIRTISADAVRPVIAQDFHDALNQVRARYNSSPSLFHLYALFRAVLFKSGLLLFLCSPLPRS